MKTHKKVKTNKKSKLNKTAKTGKKVKLSKKEKAAAREAKKKARKGDGSFPDVIAVVKSSDNGTLYGEDANNMTLSTDGETVAVYKLRRVSTISIKRKIAR